MSYHYQVNNNSNEFFDSTSYMPQMQMHHGYQDFYSPEATSSMMTSSVSVTSQQAQQQGDGSMMQSDHIGYGNTWRNDWNATSSIQSQWQMGGGGMDMGAHAGHASHSNMISANGSHVDSFRQMPSSHCYMDPAPSRLLPKKSAVPQPSNTMSRPRSTPKPFRCQTCGKAFSQAANLTAHKRIHTGEKPFMCPDCHRPFSQSSSLVTHRRTHTGERPYPCGHCDKAFTDSSTLTKHMRTHTGQKPYVCAICMMKFTQSGNLHRHMKTHKPT